MTAKSIFRSIGICLLMLAGRASSSLNGQNPSAYSLGFYDFPVAVIK